MHTATPARRVRGRVCVSHGRRVLARVLARLLRLPRASAAADTRLIITALAASERWERTFDGRRFGTRQWVAEEGDLVERFGLLEFRFRLEVSDRGLSYVQRQVLFRLARIRLPIPRSLAPRVQAREEPAGVHSIAIDVKVMLPCGGLLIGYEGVVDIEETRA